MWIEFRYVPFNGGRRPITKRIWFEFRYAPLWRGPKAIHRHDLSFATPPFDGGRRPMDGLSFDTPPCDLCGISRWCLKGRHIWNCFNSRWHMPSRWCISRLVQNRLSWSKWSTAPANLLAHISAPMTKAMMVSCRTTTIWDNNGYTCWHSYLSSADSLYKLARQTKSDAICWTTFGSLQITSCQIGVYGSNSTMGAYCTENAQQNSACRYVNAMIAVLG